ncbi:SGNH/GDSL hydrolase family protein [Alkalibacter saccharofermentans]|uniref:GDSL-like Lipase/Acylhydrolase family protein n=1 Tax=Alkalibacter saccharofermentans DSM 14828 TaxID=1120975 RepID=A0A1M4YIJ6_9FIRM|nr:GDSL-type esterase/lipase family protein [Alkalibacter saccharofermentans]SHF05635.1 GDSL-like Lipase/Acylhydrolase family protein [Alkalibacter saccharofermentans DSM 14828]
MKKKFLVILLAMLIVLAFPMQALASPLANLPETPVYVNLGDSIAYGMSAEPRKSYFERFDRFLGPSQSFNLGIPGETSGDLLGKLKTNSSFQYAVSQADIITISIGGNNLLGPIIFGLISEVDALLVYLTPEQQIEFEIFLAQMEEQLGENPDSDELLKAFIVLTEYVIKLVGEDVWNQVVYGLMNSPDLNGALINGAAQFTQDWPEIVGRVRGLNPTAKVIALNLYNPVIANESPELFAMMEGLIIQINTVFASIPGCDVIDVYSEFNKNSKSVNFSLLYDTLSIDPHPTSDGHQRIFRLLARESAKTR